MSGDLQLQQALICGPNSNLLWTTQAQVLGPHHQVEKTSELLGGRKDLIGWVKRQWEELNGWFLMVELNVVGGAKKKRPISGR